MGVIAASAALAILAVLSHFFGAETRKDFLRVDVSPARQDDGSWLRSPRS